MSEEKKFSDHVVMSLGQVGLLPSHVVLQRFQQLPYHCMATSQPVNRHASSAIEKQKAQLDKLLKDPAKPVSIPSPPKDKAIRPPREMMKNVQGSSAGAGSGEFHVYKASRRREYERLKLMDETAQQVCSTLLFHIFAVHAQTLQEADTAEFEKKRRMAEEMAEAKTAKNRAKRQKKKERAKGKGPTTDGRPAGATVEAQGSEAPTKKRRLVSGKEMVFRKPGEDEEVESDRSVEEHPPEEPQVKASLAPVVDEPKIRIHEED
jgi:hypothetical protein